MLFSEMHAEYESWQNVVKECRRLGIDMNQPKYNRLIRAIAVWGESLSALRMTQPEQSVAAAKADYKAQYEDAKREDK